MLLPNFGREAQEKLARSSVLVIGAGGLGCPVLQLLAAAGVQCIGIADFDVVELSNLHRQFLFDEGDLGKSKVSVAAKRLKALNAALEIKEFKVKIDSHNIFSIIQDFDVLVDCTDNFNTRYLINDASFIAKKPLVYGAIFRYEGQVAVFNVLSEGMISNYRDLFPTPPDPNDVQDCNEAGVLPTLSSIIGSMQANEVLKLLIGSPDVLLHQLLVFDVLQYQSMRIRFKENTTKLFPQTEAELRSFNYQEFCGLQTSDDLVTQADLTAFLRQENSILVDVREVTELPRLAHLSAKVIPLGQLNDKLEELRLFQRICFICASGSRSRKAVEITKLYFPDKLVKHVQAGVKAIKV